MSKNARWRSRFMFRNKHIHRFAIPPVFGILLLIGLGHAPARATPCTDLASTLSLPLEDGAMVVAPAVVQEITSGTYTPTGSDTPITGLPPFCRVALDVSSTGDASQSQILVEVWLPDVRLERPLSWHRQRRLRRRHQHSGPRRRPVAGLRGRQHRHGHRRAL